MLAKPSRLSRSRKPVRDAPRDAGPFIDHRACRAGPGSRRRGCAPRRRRHWRSRRRRSAGFRPPLARRNSRSASSASGFSGAPDRPPCSPAWRDLSGGRDTVVLDTISASILWSIAARTIRSGSPSPRSGATFRKIGGRFAPRLAAPPQQLVERALVLQPAQAGRVGRADVDRQVVARPAPSPARPRHNRRSGRRCPCWRRR